MTDTGFDITTSGVSKVKYCGHSKQQLKLSLKNSQEIYVTHPKISTLEDFQNINCKSVQTCGLLFATNHTFHSFFFGSWENG